MSTGVQVMMAAVRHPSMRGVRRWWPPFRRREFWVVQVLVFSIAGGHAMIELSPIVELHGASFIPVSLYLLPVVYAALAFGKRGAAPTAVWSFLLTVPNVLAWHQGLSAVGELWQAILVLSIGLFIGEWVDRERTARRQAEARERDRRASEERYRSLFEMAADAVLVLDDSGRILEANAAATTLFGMSVAQLTGTRVDSISSGLSAALASGRAAERQPVALEREGHRLWIQPFTVPCGDEPGGARLLVQLHDVTLEQERQHLLETFARDSVSAREEERRRVARDLHDGPLQSLMLLWRNLAEVGQPTDRRAAAALLEARSRAETTADELRRFSRDLRPSVLDDLGLGPALKAEATRLVPDVGVELQVESSGAWTGRLPMEIELTLFRIAQEALRNIERHAAATRVSMRLEVEPDAYRLSIADDGVGIGSIPRATALVAAGRLGIVGMQERARLVGASCEVRSTAHGTLVEVSGPRSSTGSS